MNVMDRMHFMFRKHLKTHPHVTYQITARALAVEDVMTVSGVQTADEKTGVSFGVECAPQGDTV